MNDDNHVINASFQNCVFSRICNNPKHNSIMHVEKLMEDEARIELVQQDSKNAKLEITLYTLISILHLLEIGLFDYVLC